eukprot:EG_transcript_13159
MNIAQGAPRLQITDKKVLAKAEEFLRLVNVKTKARSLGPEVELAKAMVCLDLACALGNCSVDRPTLMKLAGTGEKGYQEAYTVVQSVLQIKTTISVPDLAIKFGCARIQISTQRNLKEFQQKFLAQLSVQQRGACSFQHPAYAAVALFLTALHHHLKIDKQQLLQEVKCSAEKFESVYQQWLELIPRLKPPDVVKKEEQQRKAEKSSGSPKTFVDPGSHLPRDGIHAPPVPDVPQPTPGSEPVPSATAAVPAVVPVAPADDAAVLPRPPPKRTDDDLLREALDDLDAVRRHFPPAKRLKQTTLSFANA